MPEGVSIEHTRQEGAGSEDRSSGMSINFTVSVGYTRRRPDTAGDRWEARVDSLGLLIVGAVVTAIIIVIALPRILAWLGS